MIFHLKRNQTEINCLHFTEPGMWSIYPPSHRPPGPGNAKGGPGLSRLTFVGRTLSRASGTAVSSDKPDTSTTVGPSTCTKSDQRIDAALAIVF